MKITLVMMLKDESKTVHKAIESVVEFIDEAIIGIDDKTSDDTWDIVLGALVKRGVNNTIENFTFSDDFSTIRNKFIAKTHGDFVFVLDGHEFVDPNSLQYLKHLKQQGPGETEIFDFNIIDAKQNIVFQQPRLFKNTIKYELPIHNIISQQEFRYSVPQVVIVHDQPFDRLEARQKQRKQMNIAGLLAGAKDGDPRSMYYLADTFYEMNDHDNARKWFKKYLTKSDFAHEKYEALIRLGQIAADPKESEEYWLECFKQNVGLNEHLLLLGELNSDRGNHRNAAYYFDLAASVTMPNKFLMLNPDCYSWLPHYKKAVECLHMNDIEGLRLAINRGKTYGPEREEFQIIEDKLKARIEMEGLTRKGKLYMVASLPIFIEPYVRALNEDYYLRFETKFNPANAENADVIWCDWADHNAIAVSHYEGKAKKILRIHAYEVFNDYFLNRINFNNIDTLVFVSDHIRDYFNQKTAGWGLVCNQQVIYNGVDLDKFSIAPGKRDKLIAPSVAWAGYITNKKGAVLLLAAATELKGIEFHVCGTFQEEDVELLFDTHKPDNMTLYPWQQDLNAFFADKTHILNTSPREGCPVALLEGMAAGLEPLVYNFIGAEFFTHKPWTTVQGLGLLINPDVDYEKNRSVVEGVFNLKDKIQEVKTLIDSLIQEKDHVRENDKVSVPAIEVTQES